MRERGRGGGREGGRARERGVEVYSNTRRVSNVSVRF